MIPYILHVTVITTVCFLFYKLLLQKETFYRLNRWTLLGCLVVSFALPLLPVPREWSWREKWTATEMISTTPERAGAGLRPATETAAAQEGVRVETQPAAAQEGVRAETEAATAQKGVQPKTEAAAAQEAVVQPVFSPAPLSHVATHPHHGSGTAVAGNQTVYEPVSTADGHTQPPAGRATVTGPQARTAAETKGVTAGSQHAAAAQKPTAVPRRGTNAAVVERPTTAAVSGIADAGNKVEAGNKAEAGNKSSKTTTGTPAEKNGAGTLVRFFSGATLLLAVQWLFYLYLFGVVLFGANFLLQLAVLLYQSYCRPVIRDGRFRIVEISGDRAPCSFGNTIFINPERYDWETYNQILIHEKIHVSGRHTLDILLAELALVIQWFNPFAWLYRREVENNLEYLTDAHVLLDATIERSAYQLSLLRVSAPQLPFSLTNNYNHSLLKRRIVMMNSQRSSLHTVWKYFFLIPLLTGLMCALNKPAIALGAATNDLSLAHAPLFNFIAPAGDTVKKPARSTGDAPAAVQKASQAASSSGSSDQGIRSGERADSGEEPAYNETYGNTSDDLYNDGTAITITGAKKSNRQVIMATMATMDAYDQAVRQGAKAKYADNNLSVAIAPFTDPLQLNMAIKADIDAQMKGKVMVPDGPRFGFADDTVLTDGAWYATSYGDHLSFELKAGDEDHNWSYTLHVDKSEINPFPGQGNVSFKLVREAGTVEFKGQFDGEEGFGHFHFVPDAAYLPALKQLGVEDIEDRRQFGFFALNIKKEYVNMLVHNGYPHLTQRDLMSFAAMHIDEAYVQYWRGASLDDMDMMDPRTLIRLKAMRIDRAYVDDLKAAGYDHLSLRELESLKAQHIDKAYIQSMGHGLNNQPIPVRELVSYKAMHIDSAYIQGLRKLGYDNLAMRDLTSLYALHVTPEYIGQLQALGYKDLAPRELTSLKAMGVSPDLVKGYQAAGYKDLTARTLTSLKAMGVTPEFMKGFVDLGYTDLDARDLASLKAMGVTPDFVAGFQKLGFDHIPARTLTQLKATGVTPEYVAKMKAQGFESKDLGKYIRLKTDFN
ncbi:MAG TPA: M56 family metallopeptidase [Puia sp.]|nr:M56 family metallopeptidase [Puia sp.]